MDVRIETNLRHVQGIPILDVAGEIDIYTTPEFKEATAGVMEEGHPVVIFNMAQVTYMDSSGFGTLLSATKRLRHVNGTLMLVGCNDAITRMLQITRLNTIFGVYDTEADAVAAAQEIVARSAASAAHEMRDDAREMSVA